MLRALCLSARNMVPEGSLIASTLGSFWAKKGECPPLQQDYSAPSLITIRMSVFKGNGVVG